MSAPSEPEKFSIHEMMERLLLSPADDPGIEREFVTREDGSQAIRVRKRKRRSQQPDNVGRRRSYRVRMLQVSAVLILPIMAVFAAGAAIAFSNSARFRERLLQQIARSCGANVELEQFRMNPVSANAARLSLTWPEGNALRDITLRGVRADVAFSSFLGKSLTGESLSCADGTLILRIPKSNKPARAIVASEETPPFRFSCYGIPKARILLGDPTAPLICMQNSEVSFYPGKVNARAQLLCNRGDITIKGWPKLRMDRSLLKFCGTEVDVISIRLRHETDNLGVFELSGPLTPYVADRATTLTIQLESYLLAGIVGPELGRLFSGRIDTLSDAQSNNLAFTPGPDLDASLAVGFRNSISTAFEIKGFPFLFGLSQILKDDWFMRPVFEREVSGVLRRARGNIAISEFHATNKNRISMRGSLTMAADRKLSGNLEVGVTDAIIKASRNSCFDSLFGPSTEGFRWLNLKIGGTATTPTDNFRVLYEAATQETTPDSSAEIPTFEELTRPK